MADMFAFFPLLAHPSPSCLLLTEPLFLPPCGLDVCICGNKHKSASVQACMLLQLGRVYDIVIGAAKNVSLTGLIIYKSY